MNVLIAYGTIEGQTGKIARFVADVVKDAGHLFRLFDTSKTGEPCNVGDYDAVILAGSVHERRHPPKLEVFLTANQELLQKKRTMMLSVSLSAAFPEGQEDAQDYLDEMKMRVGLESDVDLLVAGAVKESRYDYYASQVVKHVVFRGRDYDPDSPNEFTDWGAVADGVTTFLKGG